MSHIQLRRDQKQIDSFIQFFQVRAIDMYGGFKMKTILQIGTVGD